MKTMSKVFFTAALSLSIIACGKTTKGKLDGEWTVSSYESINTETGVGSTETSTEKHDGSTLTTTHTIGSLTNQKTAKVLQHDINFKKDGTYSFVYQTEETKTVGGITTVTNETTNNEGVWNFVGTNKSEEFKKNERIALTAKKVNTITVTKIGNISTTVKGDNEMSAATFAQIFRVIESSKKELILKSEGEQTELGGSKSTSSLSMTLTAK